MRACLSRSNGPLGPGLAAMRGVLSPPPPREPVPVPDDDGLEIDGAPLFVPTVVAAPPLTAVGPSASPSTTSPSTSIEAPRANVAPVRRYPKPRGYVVGKVVCGPSATILCRAFLDRMQVPILTVSIEDDERNEGPHASMALGSLAALIMKLGSLFLEMGGTRDTIDRIEPSAGPSIWDEWRAERSAPSRQRDGHRPAAVNLASVRPVPAVAPRAPEDRRERVPGEAPRSYLAATRGGRR